MRPFNNALLTPAEMAVADQAAIAAGISEASLMDHAGRAVAAAVMRRWPKRPVAVLAGPGNNGGDGFVAARYLAAAGWPVRLGLLGDKDQLQGAAAHHAERFRGTIEPLAPSLLDEAALAIDAMFGAGLSRPVAGRAAEMIAALGARPLPVVAVDVPSGVDGATGAVLGAAAAADLTVTFFRKKPGHLLFPGRGLCGSLVVAEIGIPDSALEPIAPRQFENGPELWLGAYPWPDSSAHKYSRGHAVIAGGAVMTGAARLAARAAGRIGAGLVTVAAPAAAWPVYAGALTSVIVRPIEASGDFAALIADARVRAVLVGPGAGVSAATEAAALVALAAGHASVLDADALTAFAGDPEKLFAAIRGATVLTPHEGEFARIFAVTGDKLARARAAAGRSGAVVLLKGADTVIAAPDGRAAINANAPPDLASGGTGDVLSGLVAGLLAQGLEPFAAACAACWVHGAAARDIGPGLIAEDLIDTLPITLRRLKALSAATATSGEA